MELTRCGDARGGKGGGGLKKNRGIPKTGTHRFRDGLNRTLVSPPHPGLKSFLPHDARQSGVRQANLFRWLVVEGTTSERKVVTCRRVEVA